MIVYRLTLPKYASDLSGIGASLYGGRWNSIGNPVLYTAESSSLCILEHLVHMEGTYENPQYLLSVIDTGISAIQDISKISDLADLSMTQAAGDQWLNSIKSPILKVPSVINPLESNYLINPVHPDLTLQIQNQEWFVYDHRLLRKTKATIRTKFNS